MKKVFFDQQDSLQEEDINLNLGNQNHEDTKFQKSFELKNVAFKYPASELNILQNLNLKINKGDKIGIFGYSGAGKSTLVDIISTLNKPNDGEILIDNRKLLSQKNFKAWQNQISYVSQNSVLLDDTIRNNITFFDNDSINEEKLKQVIEHSQLSKFLKELPKGIDTSVGDLGNQLSGGQIQRIAIARALYKDREVLILDEPTSALDSNNEKIIQNILDQEKTIILISHNIDNLKKCHSVYELKDKKIMLRKNPFSGDKNHLHHILLKKTAKNIRTLITNNI